MKFRRVRQSGSDACIYQVQQDGHWHEQQDPPDLCVPATDLVKAHGTGPAMLPFQPRSFRDFMLFERHVIDASRGYARRFLPTAYRFARLYESLSGRTFPAFRPAPLWYRQPIYYFGNHLTFVPSGTPISAPWYSKALDYELELGFVLKRPLLNADPDEALRAIGAFVVLNDISARDVQRAEMGSGFGPQKSKHFMSAMSETAVTADDVLPRLGQLQASVCINGKEVCATSTAGMHHSIGEALAHASKGEQLYPGELFGTGTLPGGSGMENGHWLAPGDLLQLRIDGIGEIQHKVHA